MAFEYESEKKLTLTPSQQKLLDVIENLPFPYGGITKLKELRKKSRMEVWVENQKCADQSWKDYLNQYWAVHQQIFRHQASHRHQGEIGDRRYFVELYEIYSRNPIDGFQPPRPLLGIYTRTYKWWTGMCPQRVVLVKDNIEEYARQRDISPDIVFGFVFIQQMMHAYFDAFHSKGFPSMLELEYPFAELAMLSLIDSSRDIRFLLPEAMHYTVAQVGTRPGGFGFGAELFDRAGDDAARLISRYRDVSNWMEPLDIANPYKHNNSLHKSSQKYFEEPIDENAGKYYEDILGVLGIKWTEPLDPIQPAIGERWDFDNQPTQP